MNPFKYKVFISHAGEDKQTMAIPLYKILKDRGIPAFVDQEELPTGEEAPANMDTYMETAPIGVFLLGPEFLAKKWPMKELLCYIRRAEVAKRRHEQPPFLIPVFYRMTVKDCGDENLFGRTDGEWDGVFQQWGFFDRVSNQDTSEKEVLDAVQKVSKYTGVENADDATNASEHELKRSTLVAKVADKVAELLQNITNQNEPRTFHDGAASSSSRPPTPFTPRFLVPPIPPYIILDFSTKDGDGNYVTVEGGFKGTFWSAVRTGRDAAAAAVGMEIPGLSGMGGVGKSVVLIALGWQPDVREEFKDGIYFISLGEGANSTLVTEEVARVVDLSGGEEQAKRMKKARDLRAAVDIAAKWFEGKRVLFLLDDIWASDSHALGFFEDLRKLASATGRVALTTRNYDIAQAAGCPVTFGPREPQGAESRRILFSYAGLDVNTVGSNDSERDVETILELCAGLPLALGIAGSSVAQRIAGGKVDWKFAMEWCAEKLKRNAETLVHKKLGLYQKTVRQTLWTSLEMAEKGNESEGADHRVDRKLSELYMMLSVLRKQARVPLDMLCKLWGLVDIDQVEHIVQKFVSLNLLSFEKTVAVHDLLLDVCMYEAKSRNMISRYHKQLLQGYFHLERKEEVIDFDIPWLVRIRNGFVRDILHAVTLTADAVQQLFGIQSVRSWWNEDLHGDGYLSENLARHLVFSGHAAELRTLLCDSRWTTYRVKSGNLLSWRGDFAELQRGGVSNSKVKMLTEVNSGVEIIRDAVTLSWSFLASNPNELGFQMFGRLRGLETELPCVGEYLRSVESLCKKPWMMPMRRCLLSPRGPLKFQMPFAESVAALALTPGKSQAFLAVGKCIIAVDMEQQKITMEIKGHNFYVTCLAVGADGKWIVSGSSDGTLRVWEVETGSQVGEALEGHTGCVRCVAVTPDGTRIVSGSDDGRLRVWEVETGSQVGEALEGHTGCVRCVAVTPDGTRIVSGSRDGTLRVWEVETGSQVGEALKGHTDRVTCVAVTPDGTRIVSGSDDGTLRVWEVETGSQVGEALEGHTDRVTCVAVTPDGTRIVSGSDDGRLRVWEVETGSQVGEALEGHTDWVTCVAVTPDGTRIVSGSGDGTLRVWEVETGSQVGEALEGHTRWVTCVAVTPDGTRIVSGSHDGTLRVWEVETGSQVGEALEGHTNWVTCVAVTPDGTRIVSGSRDGTLRVWEVETGSQVGEALEGRTDWVTCVAVTPDGTRIVSGSRDGTLRVWEVETGSQVGEALEGRTDWVTCVAVTPDGTRIVSGSRDGRLRVWEVETGLQVGQEFRIHETDGVYDYIDDVQVSTGNIVTAYRMEQVVRLRIHEGVGPLVLSHLEAGEEDTFQEETETGVETYDVTCERNEIWLQFPKKTLLGTLDHGLDIFDIYLWNKRHKLLVTGHPNGVVNIYKLIL